MRWLIGVLGLLAIGSTAPPAPRAIAPNTFVKWTAADGAISWASSGVRVTLSASGADDFAGPTLIVRVPRKKPMQLTIKDGVAKYDTYVGIGILVRGQPPSVVIRGWTGGAHCCTHLIAIEQSKNGFRVVDFGSWDDDVMAWPRDRDGDGVVDLVLKDQSFLYAFGCYACGWPPPQIMTIRDGKPANVSAKVAFRSIFAADLAATREACIDGGDSMRGACTAFLADAARLGQFDAAWAQLRRARIGWTGKLPAGCDRNPTLEGCHDDFAETVRDFLRKHGYLK